MPGSDNTSYRSLDPSRANVARSGRRLRLTPKQVMYLEDVAGGIALAVLFWVLYLGVGLLMP